LSLGLGLATLLLGCLQLCFGFFGLLLYLTSQTLFGIGLFFEAISLDTQFFGSSHS
jgi:hypothetical protein